MGLRYGIKRWDSLNVGIAWALVKIVILLALILFCFCFLSFFFSLFTGILDKPKPRYRQRNEGEVERFAVGNGNIILWGILFVIKRQNQLTSTRPHRKSCPSDDRCWIGLSVYLSLGLTFERLSSFFSSNCFCSFVFCLFAIHEWRSVSSLYHKVYAVLF